MAQMTPSEERNHYVTWKIVLNNNLSTRKKKKNHKKGIPAKCFSVKDEICKIGEVSYLPDLAEHYTMQWSWVNPLCYYDSAQGRGRAGQGKLYYQHLLEIELYLQHQAW